MGRDAGISFHGIKREEHKPECECVVCKRQREAEAERRKTEAEEARRAVRQEAKKARIAWRAALRDDHEAQAMTALLLGFACVLVSGCYWETVGMSYFLDRHTAPVGFRDFTEPSLQLLAYVRSPRTDFWLLVVLGLWPLCWALAFYLDSALRYEKARAAQARSELRRLRKATLKNGKRLARERRWR
ncbi:hypothetical protein [Arthrobacter burdickii]|uniref:Transmembrane protein n=1 Tax=Arthrobacter burdickii TaxID=3035920 RepID=A0ABT8K264_9MICC|nr:hypothetical protein [Arthrobacter burdickii]MDN4611449.1 hypothetical protein [Arthrobacter burdickii]